MTTRGGAFVPVLPLRLARTQRRGAALPVVVVVKGDSARWARRAWVACDTRDTRGSGHKDDDGHGAVRANGGEDAVATTAEVAGVAGDLCDFLNAERQRDVARLVVKFGRHFDELSQLSAVRVTALDATGLTVDVESCEQAHCVCVQERVLWPSGPCQSADDVTAALAHLTALCDEAFDSS